MTTTRRRHVRYSTRWATEEQVNQAIAQAAVHAADMAKRTDSPTGELPFRVTLTPGDATRYRIFGTIDTRNDDPGRWTIHLALLDHGATPYTFDCDFGPQPEYVASKMRLGSEHTANVIADFVADLIDALRGRGVSVLTVTDD